MTQEGRRIEFDGQGPYLFQVFAEQPQGMLLEEHGVCLLQFGQLFLPVDLPACRAVAEALSNMSQTATGSVRDDMIPLEFDLDKLTELPLLTGCAGESFQHEDVIYLDVSFGEARARLRFSILAAAVTGQILSQVPAE